MKQSKAFARAQIDQQIAAKQASDVEASNQEEDAAVVKTIAVCAFVNFENSEQGEKEVCAVRLVTHLIS